MRIRQLYDHQELETSVPVIRDSFGTVAQEFGLTEENCPTHPSLITLENLESLLNKGVCLFGLFNSERQVGFVALEKRNDDIYYLEKLAVLPAFRHRGGGKQLVDFVVAEVTARRGKRISIGIINESEKLKTWYCENGFFETGTKTFPHLPFRVCFMERIVDEPDRYS